MCIVESVQPPFTFSRSTDAYMFGVMLWEMFESVGTTEVCTPWGRGATRASVMERLDRGESLNVVKEATSDVGALIRRCLSMVSVFFVRFAYMCVCMLRQ